MKYLLITTNEHAGLAKHGFSTMLVEVDEACAPHREIGITSDGAVVHLSSSPELSVFRENTKALRMALWSTIEAEYFEDVWSGANG